MSLEKVDHANSLMQWMDGPLQELVPHRAAVAGQALAHSAGYTGIQLINASLPEPYLKSIVRLGANVISPLMTRIMSSNKGHLFFDAGRAGDIEGLDPRWLAGFTGAGLYNLLGLTGIFAHGPEHFMASIALYNVPPEFEARGEALKHALLPALHRALCRVQPSPMAVPDAPARRLRLTPVETDIVRLLIQGKTNKEIGQLLGKSAETIKSRISPLMRRCGVKNRTELVSMILATQPDLARPND
ncbi:LuxR C-terminal-related transcriptional regulator [Variovorax sp. dw_308]|uniref:helix-turn-helix transcriptional regulator n=1 Tax=Variovorax sp. dw_308 TaxID=2721546 RepID=UPI001C43F74F|nr:LuxR C-terminal-related transcriptional regulator [Variovorax sp. dw_308]